MTSPFVAATLLLRYSIIMSNSSDVSWHLLLKQSISVNPLHISAHKRFFVSKTTGLFLMPIKHQSAEWLYMLTEKSATSEQQQKFSYIKQTFSVAVASESFRLLLVVDFFLTSRIVQWRCFSWVHGGIQRSLTQTFQNIFNKPHRDSKPTMILFLWVNVSQSGTWLTSVMQTSIVVH